MPNRFDSDVTAPMLPYVLHASLSATTEMRLILWEPSKVP
jgi:hypothetical protein